MYEIFINEKPLILASTDEAKSLLKNERNLHVVYNRVKRTFFPYIDSFEKGTQKIDSVVLVCKDTEIAFEELISLLKVQKAGGGLVFNASNELLAIFRRNFWDLPKGKIDKGETPEVAAVREVQEETGVKNITLDNFVGLTYHLFRNKKNERCLKWTYWYKMHTTDQQLVPQTEEDIEKAEWISKENLLQQKPIYANIVKILNTLS